MLRAQLRLFPFVVLLAALVLRWWDPTPVQLARLWTFDTFQRLQPRPYTDLPVRIVDIDEASLKHLGQWPWPRDKLAELVDRLFAAGVAVVAFDIIFAEEDRTSPDRILERLPQSESIADLRRQYTTVLPDNDALFARAVAAHNVVTGFALSDGASNVDELRVKAGVGIAGSDPRPFLARYSGAIATLPKISDQAAGNGNINVVPDVDGLIRRVSLISVFRPPVYDGKPDDPFDRPPVVPSLAVEALRIAQGAGGLKIKASGAQRDYDFGTANGVSEIQIGEVAVPTDETGSVWLNYAGHQAARFFPAWRLWSEAEPVVPADGLEGAIVFVGTSAIGLFDLRSTPLDRIVPGVEIHAELLEQMLTGDFLSRPQWALAVELLVLAALGLSLLLLLPRFGVVASAIFGLGAIAAGIVASWLAFSHLHWLFDPVYPMVVAVVVYLSSSLITYLRSEAQREQIRNAFGQYLSPALVEQLAEHPDRLTLGGETREMTFLFCDVRGFTAISERFKADPQGLTVLINRLLTPLTAEILDRSGTIDKYMGDCVMAFWNAPIDDADHAAHACDAALGMLDALAVLNGERRQEAADDGIPFVPLEIGIGVNTGECVVGNMGSEQRFDYSVLGDAVNLASRLEGQSKFYAVPTVLGEDTAAKVADRFALLELDLVAVKGKEEAVRVFTVIGSQAVRDSADFARLHEAHTSMLAAYRSQEWDAAQHWAEVCNENPLAPKAIYDLYEERIYHLTFSPPGPNWDAVYVAESK